MAFRAIVFATVCVAGCAALMAPSVSITGDPVYTISNEGVRMLYVNPFDCKQPATSLSTWVIEMDQPETVFSIQVSVVDDTIDETEEAIVVRVGGNNPLEAGASSNSLCTLADVNATSSMLIYDCQAPISGQFISISRNDAGNMNVCAFTANLGTIAFAPADASVPFVSVPAAELMIPRTPEQSQSSAVDEPDTAVPEPDATAPSPVIVLPTIASGQVQNFLALGGELVPTPGPSAVLAPELAPNSAEQPTTLPVFSAVTTDVTGVPAPAPAPFLAPTTAPVADVTLPVFAAVNSGAESVSEVEAPVPAPAVSPALAPEAAVTTTGLPVFATQGIDDGTPAPAPAPVETPALAPVDIAPTAILATLETTVPAPVPAPVEAPVPAPVTSATTVFATLETPAPAPVPSPAEAPLANPTNIFAAVQTPVPAPAPAPTPAEESKPLISPSSPLLSSLVVPPTSSPTGLPKDSFATQDPPNASGSSQNSANSSPHSGRNLSGGAIAGIVIGCVVGVALIAAVALYLSRHHDFTHSSRV